MYSAVPPRLNPHYTSDPTRSFFPNHLRRSFSANSAAWNSPRTADVAGRKRGGQTTT